MRIHYLQHVPFEDLANIEVWANKKYHSITRTQLFNEETLPKIDEFDWLIIMGGPMNIYEEDEYPWLTGEKEFIAQAIANKKIVLGICLGGQLIADVLGGKVTKNESVEIGWFPVKLTSNSKRSICFGTFPEEFTAFHWHGDTFEIPLGAVRLAESEACVNQAFEYDGRVIGLQFHIEYSAKSIDLMIQNCGDELVDGKFIQKADEIISRSEHLEGANILLNILLDNVEREFDNYI